MKSWIASMKLSSPVLAVSVLPPLMFLLWSAMQIAVKAAQGYDIKWNETFRNMLQFALDLFALGAVIAVVLFAILVPMTRYEIWKNNKVEPKK